MSTDTEVSTYWAERTLARLSPRQKVAQLVMPRIPGEFLAVGGTSWDRLRSWVCNLGVGGVVVTVGPPLETAAALNLLQDAASIPLLVSADMEHGPGQVLRGGTILPYGLETGGATRFPPLMALGATRDPLLARELGRITAIEGRAAGVHVVFAPVVDVNSNPSNPIINTRSYGADQAFVAMMATSHVTGIQEHGMLATAKHFPGHGDTSVDSHVELPHSAANRARLDDVELAPYRALIDAGVAGVMTAHVAYPTVTGNEVPATLNRQLVTGLLRDELAFDGIIFTDALDMGAIVNEYGSTASAVLALEAGVDVLLQVPTDDVAAVIDAIVAAIDGGRLATDRIDASVLRVLRAKQRLRLDAGARVELDRIPHVLAAPTHMACAADVACRSITVVRDRDGLLPIRGARVLSIIYTDVYDPFAGRDFGRELAAALPELRTILLDGRTETGRLDETGAAADQADLVLISPFIGVSAGKPGIVVVEHVACALNAIAVRRPTVLASFGNPYLLQQFPDIGTFVLAWAQWEPSQRAAARALLGAARIDGRLPVPIPPYHEIGDGITIDAVRH